MNRCTLNLVICSGEEFANLRQVSGRPEIPQPIGFAERSQGTDAGGRIKLILRELVE